MNKRNVPWMSALTMAFGITLQARDISGYWQATLKTGLQDLRVVLVIDKPADGKWNAIFSSIDQTPDWAACTPVDSITLQAQI
jgi:hypothetical protein